MSRHRRPVAFVSGLVLLGTAACDEGPAGRVTLRLESVPPSTRPADTIYVAGNFNDWQAAAPGFAMTREAEGGYVVEVPGDPGDTLEFKFTLGSWARVEAAADGADSPNRRFVVPAGGSPGAAGTGGYRGAVAAWRDPCTWPLPGSTASDGVAILDCAFEIPQLGRTRRVWVYLPPSYRAPGDTTRYPVLYMHDGQNLFDGATSYAGEWGVDEALDSLGTGTGGDGRGGDRVPAALVVGVDNGQERRFDEYNPWRNRRLGGGGEGEAYADFLALTLKPWIDARYRTLPDRQHTGIAGSSMGGLISLTAALRHPDVFGRVGVFSPAFWAAPEVWDYVRDHTPFSPDTRIWMVTGGREGDRAADYAADHRRMAALLREVAGPGVAVEARLRPEGTHSEGFWREEFPPAYRWLFR